MQPQYHPDVDLHDDMVAKTMLIINEILTIASLVGTEDLFDLHTRDGVEALWRKAKDLAKLIKCSDMGDMYGLLLATPGAPYDESTMTMDGPHFDNMGDNKRMWMIVVLCTEALGLERVSRMGKKGIVLEKVKVAQQWL